MREGWLKLEGSVPEFSLTLADDMEFLVDWYFDFELGISQEVADEFVSWLKGLELGVVVPLRGKEDYKIVRVMYP